jgi:hypothetical protein
VAGVVPEVGLTASQLLAAKAATVKGAAVLPFEVTTIVWFPVTPPSGALNASWAGETAITAV